MAKKKVVKDRKRIKRSDTTTSASVKDSGKDKRLAWIRSVLKTRKMKPMRTGAQTRIAPPHTTNLCYRRKPTSNQLTAGTTTKTRFQENVHNEKQMGPANTVQKIRGTTARAGCRKRRIKTINATNDAGNLIEASSNSSSINKDIWPPSQYYSNESGLFVQQPLL